MRHSSSSPLPKVGYLLKTYPKLSETFILNEILELENQGLDLHIFSLRPPKDEPCHPSVANVRSPVTYIPSILPTLTQASCLELAQSRQQMRQQHPERHAKMQQFHRDRPEAKHVNELLQASSLALALQRFGITHLHAHFANAPTAVAELVHWFSGIPYSFTAHAKDIYLTDAQALDRRMRSAEFVLTCTRHNQTYLQNISSSATPIYLSYHGLDFGRFQPRPQPPKNAVPLILSVGRFCEKKGFPDLLQACARLRQSGHQFRCAIVGYGEMQAEIERLIQELQLGDVVQLPGKMTQDQLVQIYRQADIFVLPCQVLENGDRDGIPNVLLEAMAMKVPVLSTNVSGIAELIDHYRNGVLVAQKDPEALATELAALLEQPALRQRLAETGCSRVRQQFSLSKNVRQIRELFLATGMERSQSSALKQVEVHVL